jgi:hypothetical protein
MYMQLADIAAIAATTHAHGAILIVDNTFMSPYFQVRQHGIYESPIMAVMTIGFGRSRWLWALILSCTP